MKDEDSIRRDLLEAEFPENLVRSRPGAFGDEIRYLPGYAVIDRLNTAFGSAWSWEVVSHQVLDDEVLVLGRLRVERFGIVKMGFGTSRVTRDTDTGQTVSLGQDLKAGSTDALKKAASLLGVGAYLYAGDTERSQGTDDTRPESQRGASPTRREGGSPRPESPRGNGNGRLTVKQHRAVFAIARERGLSGADVRSLAKDMFQRNLDYLSKSDASRLIEHLLGQ